jgi:heme/copper-type cytochrome/quinol oxidase subunit 1
MKRSWSLTEGTVLRLILVGFLAIVIAWIVSLVLSIPYFVGIALMVTRKNPSIMLPFIVWQYIAQFLASSLAGPIGTIAAALIYYDQRVRKEAFDLQLMMQAIGQAPPQAASVASPGSVG